MLKKEEIKEGMAAFVKDVLAEMKDFFKWMLIMGSLVFAATRIFPVAFVPTGSMEATIPTESVVICSKLPYWGDTNSPERGDVILFHRADQTGDSLLYTKRVVGLPGDVVEIKSGVTYINGDEYRELRWLAETPAIKDFGPFTVPEGHYFCMGDNRNNSLDSRYWEEHYIPEDKVVAKCMIVVSKDKVELLQNPAKSE